MDDNSRASIHLMYFDAGGGHAAAARALCEAFRHTSDTIGAQTVNVQELLDKADVVQKLTGIRLQDCYNKLLAREWTWGMDVTVRWLQGLIALRRRALVNCFVEYWRGNPPALVVSLIPHFNHIMFEALETCFAGALSRPPFVVVITDFADTPPGFWLEGDRDLTVCGTPHAVSQAREHGISDSKVLATSGMILRPSFYETAALAQDRSEERRGLGLSPAAPTAVVLLGGAGSSRMLLIAERLEEISDPLQVIYLCGRDQRAAAALRARRSRHASWVEGFTDRVPAFMSLGDFLIGKPGPGSLAEALQMRLPAVVVRNRRTMPQERYNAQWLLENELGLVIPSFREVDRAVRRFLSPGVLDAYRLRTARYDNRALFEVVDALTTLLAKYRATSAEVHS